MKIMHKKLQSHSVIQNRTECHPSGWQWLYDCLCCSSENCFAAVYSSGIVTRGE